MSNIQPAESNFPGRPLFPWDYRSSEATKKSETYLTRWGPFFAWVLVGAIFLTAATRRSLSLDEAATLGFIQADPLEAANVLLRSYDGVHAAYYFLVRPFSFAPLEVIRAVSGIAMATATYFLMRLGSFFGSRRTAVAAALAFVVLPLTLEASATARPFAVGTMFVVWSWYLLIGILSKSKLTSLLVISYVLITALSMIFFLLSFFSLVAQIVVVAAMSASLRRRRHIWLSQFMSLAFASPVLFISLLQRGQVAGTSTFSLGALGDSATYFFGYGLFGIGGIPASYRWIIATAYIALAIYALLVGRDRNPAFPLFRAAAISWLVIPIASLIVASAFFPLLAPRYLVYVTPALALIVGYGISQFQAIPARVGLAAGWLVLAAINFTLLLTPAGVDSWGDKSHILQANIEEEDVVIFAPDLYRLVANESGLALPTVISQAELSSGFLQASFSQSDARVWVVPYVQTDLLEGSSKWIPTYLESEGYSPCQPFRTASGSVLVFTQRTSDCPVVPDR